MRRPLTGLWRLPILLTLVLDVLLAPVPALFAQSVPRIESVHFLPPEYYVGDTVELRILVEATPGVDLRAPAALPEADWLILRNARVDEEGEFVELRLFFSSFAPGTRTLPEIAFGDFILRGMKIHTASILEGNDGEIADLQGQLYLPGTLPLLALMLGLIFTGPLLLFAASGFLRRRFRSLSLFLTRRRPYRRLKRDLKELGTQALLMSDRDFYYRLSDAVRSYISRRTGGDCITTTIREIRGMLESIFPAGDTAMRLIHFLEYADTIKFAGREAGESKKGDDLLRIGELAASMETQYREAEKKEVAGVDI